MDANGDLWGSTPFRIKKDKANLAVSVNFIGGNENE